MYIKENKDSLIIATLHSPKYNFRAIIGDTNRYKSISIKKIGQMFESPKGEIPYNMANCRFEEDKFIYTDLGDYTQKEISAEDVFDYCLTDVTNMRLWRLHVDKQIDAYITSVLGKISPRDYASIVRHCGTVGAVSKRVLAL